MQSRFPFRIAAVLVTIVAGSTQVALAEASDNLIPLTIAGGMAELTAHGEGRLAALSARQQLRDEVCIAMADGRITHSERSLILAHAKRILQPEEYQPFKQAVDRVSPPTPVAVRHPAKLACGHMQQRRPATAQLKAPLPSGPSSPPTAGTVIILTDHVVSVDPGW